MRTILSVSETISALDIKKPGETERSFEMVHFIENKDYYDKFKLEKEKRKSQSSLKIMSMLFCAILFPTKSSLHCIKTSASAVLLVKTYFLPSA